MIRPPFMARVAAGVAVTAYEETLKLPSTALALPMTTVSQVLQTTMRIQQSMTALAIKGDRLFEALGARAEETPEWAVFDEDEAPAPNSGAATNGAEQSEAPGRFALYSMPPAVETETAAEKTADAPESDENAKPAATAAGTEVPGIVEDLDYTSLTLAQLRARLRTLSVEDLTALLDYENATRARAPFVTMLSNRITTTTTK